MNYAARLQDKDYIVSLEDRGERIEMAIDGKPVELAYTSRRNKHRFLMLIDSMSYDVEVNRKDGKFSVFIYGREFEVRAEDERLAKLREVAGFEVPGNSRKEIVSPMPGLIVQVLKREGDRVAKGEGVVIMEAMKMENELKAESDGEIGEILVKPGQSVEKGVCLVRFK
jgi:biotin carboxyl carrier protein